MSVEPLYTFFLRRAAGYRFIRNVLVDHFGAEGLKGMHRLTAEGPVKSDLYSELEQVGALFFGAAVTVERELGMRADKRLSGMEELGSGRGENEDAETFRTWAKKKDDPDLFRDARMMVPVFHDLQRDKTRVWVFLGWRIGRR